MIGIIDYRMGNLRSVQKALEKQGVQAAILRAPADAADCDKLILPGVGAFADGMHYLRELGWVDVIQKPLSGGGALLGVCLGMQLLFDSSMEDAVSPDEPTPGLGIVAGRVLRFNEDQGAGLPRLKVPHMGWNTVDFAPPDKHSDNPLVAGLANHCHCYFVHGYYCQPADPQVVAGWTDYGGRFCSMLWRNNLWATQFHPEKSQDVGLTMLANFARL